MSEEARLDHLYAFPGDSRLIMLASKPAMERMAHVFRALGPGETREFELKVIEHLDETSFPRLRCQRVDAPLRCTLERNCIVIAGHARGLEYLAATFDYRAQEWSLGGHSHVYAGEIDRGAGLAEDEDERLVSDDSEELLIGGYGYLDDKLFGLPDGTPTA